MQLKEWMKWIMGSHSQTLNLNDATPGEPPIVFVIGDPVLSRHDAETTC